MASNRNNVSYNEKTMERIVKKYESYGAAGLTREELRLLKIFAGSNDSVAARVPGVNSNTASNSQLMNTIRQQNSTYSSRGVISPGGVKESGADDASQLRRSGAFTPTAALGQLEWLTTRDSKTPTGELRYKGRTYTKRQVESIMARGQSGATMGGRDQEIYDAMVREAQQRQMQAEIAQAEREKKAAEEEKRQQAIEDANRKAEYEKQLAEEAAIRAEQRKAARLKEENAAFNRYYGIPEETQLDSKDKADIAAGRKKWGYSRNAEKKMKDIESAMDDIINDESVSLDDLNEFYRQMDDVKARYSKGVQDANPEERTVGQMLEEARLNRGYYMSKDGKLERLADFEAEDEKRREKEEAAKLKAEEKAEERRLKLEADKQKRENERNGRIFTIANALMKETVEGDESSNYQDRPKYTYDEALEEAKRRTDIFTKVITPSGKDIEQAGAAYNPPSVVPQQPQMEAPAEGETTPEQAADGIVDENGNGIDDREEAANAPAVETPVAAEAAAEDEDLDPNDWRARRARQRKLSGK